MSPAPPVQHRGTVYLTFDDGPGVDTPAILRILRDTGSTATFFQLGVHRQELPQLVPLVAGQGSGVANHTYDHTDLTKLTPAEVVREIRLGPRSRCVRPPFGATNPAVRAAIARTGAREVLWTDDTRDWSRPGVAHIIQVATSPHIHDGSIVLLHDGGGDRRQTVEALPTIIATLQHRGYRIRRLPGC